MLNYLSQYWINNSQPKKPLFLLDATFRGFSQVMFQNNPLTGFLFLVAITISAYQADVIQVALGSFLATFIATTFSLFITHNTQEVSNGLHGYNACLVGTALPSLLVNNPSLWILIIVGSFLSVPITLLIVRLLRSWHMAIFTAPFVFTTWIMVSIGHLYGHFRYLKVPLPPSGEHFTYLLNATLHGVSEVFLCDNLITGIIFLVGLAIASKRVALIAFLSALTAVSVALLQGDNPQQIAAGLYGFSAVLTGIALGDIFYRRNWHSMILALIAVCLTVVLQKTFNQVLAEFQLPSLTMPFVSICWLFLLPQAIRFKRHNNSEEEFNAPNNP